MAGIGVHAGFQVAGHHREPAGVHAALRREQSPHLRLDRRILGWNDNAHTLGRVAWLHRIGRR
jgi:hypothetical protein